MINITINDGHLAVMPRGHSTFHNRAFAAIFNNAVTAIVMTEETHRYFRDSGPSTNIGESVYGPRTLPQTESTTT